MPTLRWDTTGCIYVTFNVRHLLILSNYLIRASTINRQLRNKITNEKINKSVLGHNCNPPGAHTRCIGAGPWLHLTNSLNSKKMSELKRAIMWFWYLCGSPFKGKKIHQSAMRALLYLIKRVIIVEFDAIPVHFSFRISLSHGTKSWCQDIQSDEPHACMI